MNTPTVLAQRIAAMREIANPCITSASTNSTPLETYIRLYNKCIDGSCYIDYMEGAKALYKFLSPIDIDHSLVFNGSFTSTPRICHAYEVSELATVIAGNKQSAQWYYIHNLVVYYTAKHILEGCT